MTREADSDGLRRSPIYLLHRAEQCAADLFHAEMGDRDLTPRQLAVLTAVSEKEGASQTELTSRTGIDRSTLTDLVRRLQRKGLLQRRRKSDDARTNAVTLTDKGQRVLRAAQPVGKRVDERVLDALPNKQRQQFIDALASIVDALQDLSSESSRRAKVRS